MRGFMASVGLNFAVGAALCLSAGSVATPAHAQDIGTAIFDIAPAIRSYGMGNVGVADAADPLNAFCNPAVIPSAGDIFLSSSYGRVFPDLVSGAYILHAVAGAGFSLPVGNSSELHLGGSVGFARLDYGEWEYPRNENVYLKSCPGSETAGTLAMGGELILEHKLHVGMGVALKPVWIRPERCNGIHSVNPTPKGDGIAFDLGLLISGDLLSRSDLRLSPSVGFSALNLGSDLEVWNMDARPALPANLRLGLGLRLEGRPARFHWMQAPLYTAAVNCDWSEYYKYENWSLWGAGAEAALLQALFLRVGYIGNHEANIEDVTFGVGLGVTTKAFRARIDYANVPQAEELNHVHKFGITCGVNF
jgi:hypothetical protein